MMYLMYEETDEYESDILVGVFDNEDTMGKVFHDSTRYIFKDKGNRSSKPITENKTVHAGTIKWFMQHRQWVEYKRRWDMVLTKFYARPIKLNERIDIY